SQGRNGRRHDDCRERDRRAFTCCETRYARESRLPQARARPRSPSCKTARDRLDRDRGTISERRPKCLGETAGQPVGSLGVPPHSTLGVTIGSSSATNAACKPRTNVTARLLESRLSINATFSSLPQVPQGRSQASPR